MTNRSKIAKRAVRRGKKWEYEVALAGDGKRKWWKGEDVEWPVEGREEPLYIECKERESISPWLEKALWEAENYGFHGIYIVGFFVALDFERGRPFIRHRRARAIWLLSAVSRTAPKYLQNFLAQGKRLARPGDPGIVALKRIARKPGDRAFRCILMSYDDFRRWFGIERR